MGNGRKKSPCLCNNGMSFRILGFSNEGWHGKCLQLSTGYNQHTVAIHAMKSLLLTRPDSINKKIFRAAMAVALASIVVKPATAVKEIAVAHSFGRSDTLDAFLFAFVLPSFAVNLVVGAVSA